MASKRMYTLIRSSQTHDTPSQIGITSSSECVVTTPFRDHSTGNDTEPKEQQNTLTRRRIISKHNIVPFGADTKMELLLIIHELCTFFCLRSELRHFKCLIIVSITFFIPRRLMIIQFLSLQKKKEEIPFVYAVFEYTEAHELDFVAYLALICSALVDLRNTLIVISVLQMRKGVETKGSCIH